MFSAGSEEEGDEGSEETRDREVTPQYSPPGAVPNLVVAWASYVVILPRGTLVASFRLLLQVGILQIVDLILYSLLLQRAEFYDVTWWACSAVQSLGGS